MLWDTDVSDDVRINDEALHDLELGLPVMAIPLWKTIQMEDGRETIGVRLESYLWGHIIDALAIAGRQDIKNARFYRDLSQLLASILEFSPRP